MSEGANRLVYISGAITGATAEDKTLFQFAALDLRARGFRAYIPPEIPGGVKSEDRWAVALCSDVATITISSGIAVLPTYERSKGALLEIFTAISLKKEIILLEGQDESWREQVLAKMKEVQAVLWRDVDRSRFTHHTDIPL